MSTDDLRTTLIMREWDEAWAHSRHLEDLRRQYLGFFFTALLGVTAISASYLARRHLSPSGSVLTIAALALGLQTLAVYLYLAVSRVNVVLDHYLEVVWAIRDQIALDGSSSVDLSDHRRPPSPPRPGRLGRVILWHGAEPVLGLGAGVLVLILAGNVFRATLEEVSSAALVLSSAALVLSVGSCVFVYWLLHPSAKGRNRDEPSASRARGSKTVP